MKTEKDFTKRLRDKCSGPNLKFYTFENCGSQMVPDLYFVPRGTNSGWLEAKLVKKDSDRVPWRPGQQQWLREHADAGGKGFLIVYLDETEEIIFIEAGKAGRMKPELKFREVTKFGVVISLEDRGWDGVARYLTPAR